MFGAKKGNLISCDPISAGGIFFLQSDIFRKIQNAVILLIYVLFSNFIVSDNPALFWVKLIKVLKSILRYWAFKVFLFGNQKHPLEWLLDSIGSDLNIKIG